MIGIYEVNSGEILRLVQNCPPDQVADQCGPGEEFFLNCPATATHIIDWQPVVIVPETTLLTEDELMQQIVGAIQRHLDATARTRNYDNILSLASYAASTDPAFAAEGAAGVAWRDECWRYCYAQMIEIKAGHRPMPTPEEAVAELPPMVWP